MKDNAGFTCLGAGVFALLSIVIGAVMNGWVLSTLWAWFVIPIFGLHEISIVQAVGFSLVVGMLVKQGNSGNSTKKETAELVGEIIGYAVLTPLFTLLLGYIVKLFL